MANFNKSDFDKLFEFNPTVKAEDKPKHEVKQEKPTAMPFERTVETSARPEKSAFENVLNNKKVDSSENISKGESVKKEFKAPTPVEEPKQEHTESASAPAKSTESASAPVKSIESASAPAKSTESASEPVKSIESASAPAKSTESAPAQVKSTASAAKPAKSNGNTRENNPGEVSSSAKKGLPPAPEPKNIPKFPRSKYIDEYGKRLKKIGSRYTFTCPNCGTTITDEDCMIDFYRAIRKYMTGEYADANGALEDLTKMFFPKEPGSISVFYEADWKTVESLEKDAEGYTLLRCRDLLQCMLGKVIKGIEPKDIETIIPHLINKDAMHSVERDNFLKGLVICLAKCGVVVNKRREDPVDLATLVAGYNIDTNKIEVNNIRLFIQELYNNRDKIIMRAKISRHMEDLADKTGEYLAGFDFEFGLKDELQIIERRCPQAECGKCVSHINGEAEEYLIGMLGGPGSGKTAYMTALLNFLESGDRENGSTIRLSRSGVNVDFDDRDCDGGMGDFIETYLKKYQNGEFVRKTEVGDGQHYSVHVHGKACPSIQGQNPVDEKVFSINKYQNVHRIITVVDIAGEQISDKENLQAVVSSADLFWFCVSPGQLDPSVRRDEEIGYAEGNTKGEDEENNYKISDIIGIIKNVRSTFEINVPIALIISKSDIFAEADDLCPQVFRNKDGSSYIGMADMLNLTSDMGGEQLFGGKGFAGYKVLEIGKYQDTIQNFFRADGRKGDAILSAMYGGDKKRKCAFFAVAAYGTNIPRNFRPYGVYQPFLWTLAVIGVLPVVSPRDPVEEVTGIWPFKKTQTIYNKNYQAGVFTPAGLCKDERDAEKFNKLLFW